MTQFTLGYKPTTFLLLLPLLAAYSGKNDFHVVSYFAWVRTGISITPQRGRDSLSGTAKSRSTGLSSVSAAVIEGLVTVLASLSPEKL